MREKLIYLLAIFLLANVFNVIAAASFQVTQLDCNEVAVGDTFSCTATVQNTGDSSGTINTFTLIPNEDNWLEQSSYVQSGGSFTAGESKEITFTGLKAVKGGPSQGFSEIRMDDVSDTSDYVTSVQLNIIDVSVSITNSDTNVARGSSFITTVEITAVGNINSNTTFSIDSGGCTIEDQEASVTDDSMTHGGKLSNTWNVTMGSGNCKFTITTLAEGSGIKVDSTEATISCSDCPTGEGTSSSSSGGGGGALTLISLGMLTEPVTYDLGKSEKLLFILAGKNHSVRVSSLGETEAEFIIESETQKIKLAVGDTKNVDITGDGKDDISIKLDSINILTKKARITLTPLTAGGTTQPQKPAEGETGGREGVEAGNVISEEKEIGKAVWFLLRIMVIIAIIVVLVISRRRLQYLKRHWAPPKTFKFKNYARDLYTEE